MHYQYFEEELIALRREVSFHPDLQVILVAQTNPDFYIHLAEIAAYCKVVLDGTYSRDDILKICDVLTASLQKKRCILVQ